MALTQEELQQIAQAVAQATQAATTQAATQAAEQVGQQMSESISQSVQKFMQTQGQTTGAQMIAGREELGDIGGTERLEKENMDDASILFANTKRTYDEYQEVSLDGIRMNKRYIEKVLSDAHSHDMAARAISNQALAHLVETGNMVGKQAVRHGDVAIDRQWNVDEQGYQVDAIISRLMPTLESIVAKVLADMAASKPAA